MREWPSFPGAGSGRAGSEGAVREWGVSEAAEHAGQGETDVAGTAHVDRWPALPDDGALWTPPAPAFTSEHLRRLDDEQRGR